MPKQAHKLQAPHRCAKSIDEFCAAYGIGRNSAYNEISAGRLKTITIGRRRLITDAQELAWLRSKESAA